MATKRMATITLQRNGLAIELQVDLDSIEHASGSLLDVMRHLVAKGYKELIPDLPPVHSGALGEVNEGDIYEERKRIGF